EDGPPTGWQNTSGLTKNTTVSVGGSGSVVFSNVATGELHITKHTTGGDGTFNFTVTGPNSYTASGSITTSGGTGTPIGISGLSAGTYTVTEDAQAGWTNVNPPG